MQYLQLHKPNLEAERGNINFQSFTEKFNIYGFEYS